MRVHLSKRLLKIVDGSHDWFDIGGRLRVVITDDVEKGLQELPAEVQRQFNFTTTPSQSVDYRSEPIVYTPDRFEFSFDIENLGRLARETLIHLAPLSAGIWEDTHGIKIAELWLGGRGELLDDRDTDKLKAATRQVRTLPVYGKSFVFGKILPALARDAGPAGVRHVGGIVLERVGPDDSVDYLVTDRPDQEEDGLVRRASRIIDSLTLTVMVSDYE